MFLQSAVSKLENTSAMSEKVEWIYGTLAAIGSSFATWVFARKRNAVETQSTELENIQKGLSVYREMLGDLRTELEEQNKRNFAKIDSLEKEIVAMQSRCSSVSCPNYVKKG